MSQFEAGCHVDLGYPYQIAHRCKNARNEKTERCFAHSKAACRKISLQWYSRCVNGKESFAMDKKDEVLCWGENQPKFASCSQFELRNTFLQVGDIVLFSNCRFRNFCGAIEAHYSNSDCRIDLLVRNGRHFRSAGITVKETLHLLQWMKEHPEQVEKPRACGRGSTNSDLNAHSADVSFTKLCDLQPETIVNVRCRLREPKEKEDRIIGTLNGLETNFGAYRRHVEMTDGTLGESQAVTLCLWDQQAHKKHIESLLDHDGTFEILNLIITLDGNAKFLLANSSSATLFVKWTTSNSLKLPENAPQPVISEEKVALCKSIDSSAMCPKNKSGNIFFLEDVRVERVDFGKPLGSPSCVRPPFTPLLIECCCRFCEETLPRFNANVIPILYMSCPKRQCKIKRSKRKQTTLIRTIDEIDSSTDEVKACFWRYRAITMRLRAIREIKPHLYTVTAQDPVIQNLAGNIKASLLVDSETFLSNDFDAKWRVASCLNSIVRSNSRFQAALQMVTEDDSTQFSPANTPTWALLSLQAAF